MAKKKIYFIPHYFGNLRYFGKLIPFLKDQFDLNFLFTPKALLRNSKKEIEDMRDYGAGLLEGRAVEIIEPTKPKFWLPLFSLIGSRLAFRRAVREFLEKTKPDILIGAEDNEFYNNLLFLEANKKGIKTIVLQWAIFAKSLMLDPKNKGLQKKEFKNPNLLERCYGQLVESLSRLLGLYRVTVNKVGGGTAQKVGVINKYFYDLLKGLGVPESKLEVVGSIDWELARAAQRAVSEDEEKKRLQQKHGLDLAKKNIAIFSIPFNLRDVNILSDSEQLSLYERLVKMIQEILPRAEYDVLLKIHPAENLELYAPLRKLGVKLFDKAASNEELIALSDLYIEDSSTTNFIAIIMNKDCIFLNLFQLPVIEESKEIFGIKKFVYDHEELRGLLAAYRDHALPKQYDQSAITTDNCAQKIISFINS